MLNDGGALHIYQMAYFSWSLRVSRGLHIGLLPAPSRAFHAPQLVSQSESYSTLIREVELRAMTLFCGLVSTVTQTEHEELAKPMVLSRISSHEISMVAPCTCERYRILF